MKKTISLALLVLFSTAIFGCSHISKPGIESGVATKEEATTIESSKLQESEKTTENQTPTPTPEPKMEDFQIKELGKLYQLVKTPIISSLSLSDLFKNPARVLDLAPPSTYGIRCIFDLDEAIYMEPTCAKNDELYVALLPHQENASYYFDYSFSYLYTEYAWSQLLYSEEGSKMISMLFMKDKGYKPGYYDLVFFEETKPIAVVMIKIFGVKGIEKTKLHPRTLMSREISKTQNGAIDTPTKTPTKKPKKKKK